MPTVFLLGLAAAIIPAADQASAPTVVEISGREIRLADLSAVPGFGDAARSRFADRVVAALPMGRGVLAVRADALAELTSRRLPALAPISPAADALVLIRRSAVAQAGAAGDRSCAVLGSPVALGEAVTPDDVTPAACDPASPTGPVRYSREDGSTRAAADLAVGTYMGRLSARAPAEVTRGSGLTIVSSIGAVTIRREVEALQPARRGGRLFVRDEDGEIFSLPLRAREEVR